MQYERRCDGPHIKLVLKLREESHELAVASLQTPQIAVVVMFVPHALQDFFCNMIYSHNEGIVEIET
jgi:hypothetical protein